MGKNYNANFVKTRQNRPSEIHLSGVSPIMLIKTPIKIKWKKTNKKITDSKEIDCWNITSNISWNSKKFPGFEGNRLTGISLPSYPGIPEIIHEEKMPGYLSLNRIHMLDLLVKPRTIINWLCKPVYQGSPSI